MTTQDAYCLWYSRGHLIKGIGDDHDDDLPRESVGNHLFRRHLGVHVMNHHGWSVGQTMCHEPPWLVGGADLVPWTAMVGRRGRPCAMNHHGWSMGQTMCHEPPWLVNGADNVPWTTMIGQWGRPCAMNHHGWSVKQTMCDAAAGAPCYVLWILVLTTLGGETSYFQLLQVFLSKKFLSLHQCPSASRSTHTNPTPHTILF